MYLYSLLMLSWLCLLSLQQLLNNIKSKRFRRWWVKPHLSERVRRKYGAFATKFNYFKNHDHEEFYSFVGMLPEQFEILLRLVGPRLRKSGPRTALAPELRLAAVLSFLVHRSSPRKVAWSFFIGRSTMYKLVPEVCRAIHLGLKDQYLKFPSTRQEWFDIVDGFVLIFDLPNCLGALDGKHFEIKCPPHSGAFFWCWKQFYSIVLMAVCDANRVFRWVSVGHYGSLNDTTIFRSSNLGRALDAGSLPIMRERRPLPNTNDPFQLFFIADGGFPSESYLVRPFQLRPFAPLEERIFNLRHGTGRRIVERGFGTLTRKFKIFDSPLDFNLATDELIIMACVCLHNFLIMEDENVMRRYRYVSDDEEDEDSEDEDDGSSQATDLSHGSSSNSDSSCGSSMSVASDNDSCSSMDASDASQSCDDVTSDSTNSDGDDASVASADNADNADLMSGQELRDRLTDYFMSEAGRVDWQENRA